MGQPTYDELMQFIEEEGLVPLFLEWYQQQGKSTFEDDECGRSAVG
jgi:hypothetical protein